MPASIEGREQFHQSSPAEHDGIHMDGVNCWFVNMLLLCALTFMGIVSDFACPVRPM
jgi:hypothetical protein